MRMLIALFAVILLMLTSKDASAWGLGHSYSSHHNYRSHWGRGETCWRTNRQTKARFRIC
jgi:hypothetical protein